MIQERSILRVSRQLRARGWSGCSMHRAASAAGTPTWATSSRRRSRTPGPNRPSRRAKAVKCVVVRTAKSARADGSYVRFDDNAAVVIDAPMASQGHAHLRPHRRELRERNHLKIISLAPEVSPTWPSRPFVRKTNQIHGRAGPRQGRRSGRGRPPRRPRCSFQDQPSKKHAKGTPQPGGAGNGESYLPMSKVMVVCPKCCWPARPKGRSRRDQGLRAAVVADDRVSAPPTKFNQGNVMSTVAESMCPACKRPTAPRWPR